MGHTPFIDVLSRYLSLPDWVHINAMSCFFRHVWPRSEERLKASKVRALIHTRFGWQLEGVESGCDPFKHVGANMSSAKLPLLHDLEWVVCTGGCGNMCDMRQLVSRLFAPFATCVTCWTCGNSETICQKMGSLGFVSVRMAPAVHQDKIRLLLGNGRMRTAYEFIESMSYLSIKEISERYYNGEDKHVQRFPALEEGYCELYVKKTMIIWNIKYDMREYVLVKRFADWQREQREEEEVDRKREKEDDDKDEDFYSSSSSSSNFYE